MIVYSVIGGTNLMLGHNAWVSGTSADSAPDPVTGGSQASAAGNSPTPSDATRQVRPTRSQRLLATYVRSAESLGLTPLRGGLWNSGTSQPSMIIPDERDTVLEQYKLYVEIADRVSARLATANTFFLPLSTGVFTIVGVCWQHRLRGSPALLVVPWSMFVVQCLAWFWILRSYRQLNIAKYAVIGTIEEGSPASPYWGAAQVALGGGRDPARYWPLSDVEQRVPGLFAAGCTAGLLSALLT